MSKEARALLKRINDKKNAIKSLVNEGKTKEAREAKEELVDMQDRFNILMDLEDGDVREIGRRWRLHSATGHSDGHSRIKKDRR